MNELPAQQQLPNSMESCCQDKKKNGRLHSGAKPCRLANGTVVVVDQDGEQAGIAMALNCSDAHQIWSPSE